jgi:hypothetical protein
MDDKTRLDDLKRDGRMRWLSGERAWVAQPDDVVDALASDGYQEYKREVARSGRDSTGGVWQGINTRTGSVASAIWVRRPSDDAAIVFIDIDGRPLTESA